MLGPAFFWRFSAQIIMLAGLAASCLAYPLACSALACDAYPLVRVPVRVCWWSSGPGPASCALWQATMHALSRPTSPTTTATTSQVNAWRWHPAAASVVWHANRPLSLLRKQPADFCSMISMVKRPSSGCKPRCTRLPFKACCLCYDDACR